MTKSGLRLLSRMVFCYLIALATLYFFQQSFIYHPDKTLVDPSRSKVAGIELIKLKTSDNEIINVWHLAPREPGAPVLLYFNGNGGNIADWDARWRRIAEAGAGFVAVSYRGYGGSTGSPSETGLHRDAEAAYAWVANHYAQEKIVIHGYSLGTGVATRLASQHGARALILEAPYMSVADRAAEKFPIFPVQFLIRDKFRSRDWIGDVAFPILIAHGTNDQVIPVEHGRRLRQLALAPTKMIEFEGGTHTSGPFSDLYPMIWKFIGYEVAAAEQD